MTTQARPFDNLYNFSGFSDGDRYAFVARKFGVNKIGLAGFSFETPDVNPIKKTKLKLAKKLIGTTDF